MSRFGRVDLEFEILVAHAADGHVGQFGFDRLRAPSAMSCGFLRRTTIARIEPPVKSMSSSSWPRTTSGHEADARSQITEAAMAGPRQRMKSMFVWPMTCIMFSCVSQRCFSAMSNITRAT